MLQKHRSTWKVFFSPVRIKKKEKKRKPLRSLKKTAARSLCGRPSHAEYQQLSSGSGGSARIRNRYVCGAQVKQIWIDRQRRITSYIRKLRRRNRAVKNRAVGNRAVRNRAVGNRAVRNRAIGNRAVRNIELLGIELLGMELMHTAYMQAWMRLLRRTT